MQNLLSKISLVALILGTSAAIPLSAQAQDAGTPTPKASSARIQPDSAQRKTMAGLHRDMANCLESSRPFDECRQQMMQNMHGKKNSYCPGCGCAMDDHRSEDSENG